MDQNGPFWSANRTLGIPEQMCTLVDDCAQIADNGLKPSYESPRLDFPEFSGTLSGTLPGTLLARRARETPVTGRGVRNNCRFSAEIAKIRVPHEFDHSIFGNFLSLMSSLFAKLRLPGLPLWQGEKSARKSQKKNRRENRSKIAEEKKKTWVRNKLREVKLGGFQTEGFPTFLGKGADCVADPFGNVPRRCFHRQRKRQRTNRVSPPKIGKILEKSGNSPKERTKKGRTSPDREAPPPRFQGTERAHKLFRHKLFGPHPKPHI